MDLYGAQMEVALYRICDPIESPRSYRQTKRKVLENVYQVVQDEGQEAVEQPTDGDVEVTYVSKVHPQRDSTMPKAMD